MTTVREEKQFISFKEFTSSYLSKNTLKLDKIKPGNSFKRSFGKDEVKPVWYCSPIPLKKAFVRLERVTYDQISVKNSCHKISAIAKGCKTESALYSKPKKTFSDVTNSAEIYVENVSKESSTGCKNSQSTSNNETQKLFSIKNASEKIVPGFKTIAVVVLDKHSNNQDATRTLLDEPVIEIERSSCHRNLPTDQIRDDSQLKLSHLDPQIPKSRKRKLSTPKERFIKKRRCNTGSHTVCDSNQDLKEKNTGKINLKSTQNSLLSFDKPLQRSSSVSTILPGTKKTPVVKLEPLGTIFFTDKESGTKVIPSKTKLNKSHNKISPRNLRKSLLYPSQSHTPINERYCDSNNKAVEGERFCDKQQIKEKIPLTREKPEIRQCLRRREEISINLQVGKDNINEQNRVKAKNNSSELKKHDTKLDKDRKSDQNLTGDDKIVSVDKKLLMKPVVVVTRNLEKKNKKISSQESPDYNEFISNKPKQTKRPKTYQETTTNSVIDFFINSVPKTDPVCYSSSSIKSKYPDVNFQSQAASIPPLASTHTTKYSLSPIPSQSLPNNLNQVSVRHLQPDACKIIKKKPLYSVIENERKQHKGPKTIVVSLDGERAVVSTFKNIHKPQSETIQELVLSHHAKKEENFNLLRKLKSNQAFKRNFNHYANTASSFKPYHTKGNLDFKNSSNVNSHVLNTSTLSANSNVDAFNSYPSLNTLIENIAKSTFIPEKKTNSIPTPLLKKRNSLPAYGASKGKYGPSVEMIQPLYNFSDKDYKEDDVIIVDETHVKKKKSTINSVRKEMKPTNADSKEITPSSTDSDEITNNNADSNEIVISSADSNEITPNEIAPINESEAEIVTIQNALFVRPII